MIRGRLRPKVSAWVRRGYVMIRVDHRGIGSTPGVVSPFSMQEALDYYDAMHGLRSKRGAMVKLACLEHLTMPRTSGTWPLFILHHSKLLCP